MTTLLEITVDYPDDFYKISRQIYWKYRNVFVEYMPYAICSRLYKSVKTPGPDLQNILRQSYDNAKVTIDLRRTSHILRLSQNKLTIKLLKSLRSLRGLMPRSTFKLSEDNQYRTEREKL